VASAIYFTCVLLAAVTLLVSVLRPPEKDWYVARALAESVKTLAWRFVMGSEPFGLSQRKGDAELKFSAYLSQLINMHRGNAEALLHGISHGSQITDEMRRVRALPFEQRRDFYLDARIKNQLGWYSQRSILNKKRAALLSWFCILVYGAGITVAAVQIVRPLEDFDWVSEPILVLAAGLLGWIQAKRYSELASSYNLAVHEISKIQANIAQVATPEQLAQFVNDSETAFSREHTQWVARQGTGAL
jgi:hypothetical protein